MDTQVLHKENTPHAQTCLVRLKKCAEQILKYQKILKRKIVKYREKLENKLQYKLKLFKTSSDDAMHLTI